MNGGRAVEQRRHAPFAVAVARRQQRFWRFAWLLGPLIGVVQIAFVELPVAMGNTVATTLALALMSWFWYRRANRAEARNRELIERPATNRNSHTPGRSQRGHLTDRGARGAVPGSPRPPRPRGRKRR